MQLLGWSGLFLKNYKTRTLRSVFMGSYTVKERRHKVICIFRSICKIHYTSSA